jgi:hypothetical protein
VKIKQQTVIENWTVSTSCVSPIECSGVVTSDRGWTGTARLDDFWFIEHDLPNWMPCPDGTFATGHQKFMVWGVNPVTGLRENKNIGTFAGVNMTKSDSGACGVNKPKSIELPVRMERVA